MAIDEPNLFRFVFMGESGSSINGGFEHFFSYDRNNVMLEGLTELYHFKGYPRFLFMVYQEVFCQWLSRTGNYLEINRPILDIYRNVEENGYMEIDICFHLK